MSTSDDDLELITAARRGDRSAIEALFARYEPAIYRFGCASLSAVRGSHDGRRTTWPRA